MVALLIIARLLWFGDHRVPVTADGGCMTGWRGLTCSNQGSHPYIARGAQIILDCFRRDAADNIVYMLGNAPCVLDGDRCWKTPQHFDT